MTGGLDLHLGVDKAAALILGYATPPPHAWSRALEALAEVVQENLSLSGLSLWTGGHLVWLAC